MNKLLIALLSLLVAPCIGFGMQQPAPEPNHAAFQKHGYAPDAASDDDSSTSDAAQQHKKPRQSSHSE